MSPHDKKNPADSKSQALADAEAQLAIAAQKYKETGETQFGSLLMVCSTFTKLKATFKQTAKHERPASTWKQYVVAISNRYNFGFKSTRMANLCIRLDKDIAKVGLGKVKSLVADGSYRGVRNVVNTLIGKPQTKKQKKSAAQCLDCAIKEIEAAEGLLPDATKEIDSIKAAIQKLIADSKSSTDPADKGNSPALVLPPEWQQKLAKANAASDQVAINEVVDELWLVLVQGGVTGFPAEVTFTKKVTDVGEQLRRHLPIKKYIGQLKKSLGYNFAMPKPPAIPPASTTKASKGGLSTGTKATFTPKDVKEIAQQLGSKSALGRAVGKSSKHADYWVKVNKFPAKLKPKLVKAFNEKGQALDLSLIATIK